MSPLAEEVLAMIRRLPREEQLRIARLRLADQLRESVEDEPSASNAAWSDEVADRVEALERGELETVSAKEVFARVRAKHAR